MATLSIKRTGLHIRRDDGTAPRIISVLEADSQSFSVGDLVYIYDSASPAYSLTECGADPGTILGIALKDSTNVTTGNIMIPVVVLDEHTEFSMSLYHATASSATFSDLTKIGYASYGIAQNAAGKWVVDIADASNSRVVITDYPVENEKLGDIYMQVMCKVLSAIRQVI